MANSRSPNYPNHDLGGALLLADKIFKQDGRNKVSRAALAAHLGHDSLSGPALGKIGALRAYGLLEGGGEEMRISEDAIAALKAPEGSNERSAALARLALRPALFQAIKKEYRSRPSKQNLEYWLITQSFSATAAAIAADSYLKTMTLVESLGGSYNAAGADDDGKVEPPPAPPPGSQQRVKIMDGERIVFTEEGQPNQYLKLIASGEVDDGLLEALDDFVKRQRRRVALTPYNPADALKRDKERFEADLRRIEAAGLSNTELADTVRRWIAEVDQLLEI